jgi:hypothetical protein
MSGATEMDPINMNQISIQLPRLITHRTKTIISTVLDNKTKDQVGPRPTISIKEAVIETGMDIGSHQESAAFMKSHTKDQNKTTVDTTKNIMSKDGRYLTLMKSTYVKGVQKTIVTKGDLSILPSSLEANLLTEDKAGDLMIIIWLINPEKCPLQTSL